DQAAQAIAEGRDAVQNLRASTTVTNDLAEAIGTLGAELAAAQKAGITDPGTRPTVVDVAVEGTSRDLHPIIRDDIYRIAGEALRFAPGPRAPHRSTDPLRRWSAAGAGAGRWKRDRPGRAR